MVIQAARAQAVPLPAPARAVVRGSASDRATAEQSSARCPARNPARLDLDAVTLRYPGEDAAALEEVSVSVPAGRIVGVVGPSGSGKSTLLAVAGGRLAPTAGRVLVDGLDLACLPVGQRRRHAAWLGQRPDPLPGTLRENIAPGSPDAPGDLVAEAAHAAGLGPLLARLPQGLETVLGEPGHGLSDGEAQRVAVARVLLSGAPVLLLDEPTARLDAAEEEELIDSLSVLAVGRTVMVAAHSLALLRICDRVVELDRGHSHVW
jgi:ABC-type transport system involved in cytochrome bd biosynthesis fused ATPase/permease subunit